VAKEKMKNINYVEENLNKNEEQEDLLSEVNEEELVVEHEVDEMIQCTSILTKLISTSKNSKGENKKDDKFLQKKRHPDETLNQKESSQFEDLFGGTDWRDI
jgi:hypothetical protein